MQRILRMADCGLPPISVVHVAPPGSLVRRLLYLSRLTAADQFLYAARQAMALQAQGTQGLMDPACVERQARAIAQLVTKVPRPSPELREFGAELSEAAGY
ncbi:hypothetical protein [Streptomyces lushanensis]|uniref:hypothetical protein n=1 Tax=Streptomyces lushanensis TaxID=1434255 RepID=UPI00082CB766|nr:hypothetical protein [Streptomyces lushanensis]